MSSRGASASCRKKIFSPGMSRMPAGSDPRERMWKLSRQVPSAGWSARWTISPRVVERVHVPAPRERLVGDSQAAGLGPRRRARAAARPRARRRRSPPMRRSSRRGSCPRRAPPSPRTWPRRGRTPAPASPRSRGTADRARSRGRAHPPARVRRRVAAASRSGRSRTARRRRSRRSAAAAQLLLQRAAQADGGDRAAGHRSVAKWRSMRSRSAVRPVKRSKEPAACRTTIPPPSSVRHPAARASRSSSVSSGR